MPNKSELCKIPNHSCDSEDRKHTVTLPGVVEKIVDPAALSQPETVQIAVEGADELYREIRIENTLETSTGKKVKLKPGAEVDVKIEASPNSIEKEKAA